MFLNVKQDGTSCTGCVPYICDSGKRICQFRVCMFLSFKLKAIVQVSYITRQYRWITFNAVTTTNAVLCPDSNTQLLAALFGPINILKQNVWNFTVNNKENEIKSHQSWILFDCQRVEKYIAFYGTWRFVTMYTTARCLCLSWEKLTQNKTLHPVSLLSIPILPSHLHVGAARMSSTKKKYTALFYTPDSLLQNTNNRIITDKEFTKHWSFGRKERLSRYELLLEHLELFFQYCLHRHK